MSCMGEGNSVEGRKGWLCIGASWQTGVGVVREWEMCWRWEVSVVQGLWLVRAGEDGHGWARRCELLELRVLSQKAGVHGHGCSWEIGLLIGVTSWRVCRSGRA